MNLAQKVSSDLVALISILVITASVGFYSTYSLSNLLNFITTTAWDTADGAMEGSIGIEAQMLAVERITAGHNDHSNDLLKEGEELADEALNRMIAAGLMSPNEVETGAGLVNETGETLAGIVNGVDIVANRINSISLGSKEQSSGISQINQAISQIDDMTQQNAALVEETSSAANALNDQAKRLQELVVFFKA